MKRSLDSPLPISVFFLFLTSSLNAATYTQLQKEQLATVRIFGYHSDSSISNLTGIIISYDSQTNTAYVLTNSHLYSPIPPANINIWPPQHPKPYHATTLKYYPTKEPDIAILSFSPDPNFPIYHIPLYSSTPENNANVRIRGYGKDRFQKLHTGQIQSRNKYLSKSFEISTPISGGDSGSPVFYTSNSKSYVVGLCWGNDDLDTNHAMAEPISKISTTIETAFRNCSSGQFCRLFPNIFQQRTNHLVKVLPPRPTPQTQIITKQGIPGRNGTNGKDGLPGPQGKQGIVDYSKLEALQNEVTQLKKEIALLRKSIPVSFEIKRK